MTQERVEWERRFTRDVMPIIARCVRSLASARKLLPDEAEDFAGDLHLKFIADDYYVLRVFTGASSLDTYVNVVAARAFKDLCDRKWGKWRPGAYAKSKGPYACELECLIARDRHPYDEAIRRLIDRHPQLDLDDVREWAKHFKPRVGRGEESLEGQGETLFSAGRPSDDQLVAREIMLQELAVAVDTIIAALGDEDRVMLQMHLRDGVTLTAVSRVLRIERSQIYPRYHKLRERIVDQLASLGYKREDVLDLVFPPDES